MRWRMTCRSTREVTHYDLQVFMEMGGRERL